MIQKLVVCLGLSTSLILLPIISKCQEAQVKHIQDLMEVVSNSQDSLVIINFWATWCKPCVKELTCFYQVDHQMKNRGVRVLLVSLDFKRQFETTLKPFLSKRGPGPETWLLDEPDYDAWINKIDASWLGAIPATLFINNHKAVRLFHEGEFTCGELNETINKLLIK